MITSDGINAKVGTITSDLDRFMFWRTVDGSKEVSSGLSQLQVMLYGMMDKKRFLDIISKYSFFVQEEDKAYKILPGYHQFLRSTKLCMRHIWRFLKMEAEKLAWSGIRRAAERVIPC